MVEFDQAIVVVFLLGFWSEIEINKSPFLSCPMAASPSFRSSLVFAI